MMGQNKSVLIGVARDRLRALVSVAFASSMHAYAEPVNEKRVLEEEDVGRNWLVHGRTFSEQRFSPLDQINPESIGRLGLEWYLDIPSADGLTATPLVIDGVMYFSGNLSQVWAVDVETGKQLWHYAAALDDIGESFFASWAARISRGVPAWGDEIFLVTPDNYLVALDRETGEQLWKVLTANASDGYGLTGAPRVGGGKVFVGHSGGDGGARGFIDAFDARIGSHFWRFYTVPGNPDEGFEQPELAKAAKTWRGEWWEYGGGGSAWDSMTYDPELDLLFIGTDSSAPWDHVIRSEGDGDNLFLVSVIALDVSTGEYRWHYQQVPGDTWVFGATQHMILADVEIDGKTRSVILQAPKNEFFYVLDRKTGEVLRADKYTLVNWASHIYMNTGRPVEIPGSRCFYEPYVVYPGDYGAHNWHSMCFNPYTGLVYFPVYNLPGWVEQPRDEKAWRWKGIGYGFETGQDSESVLQVVSSEKQTDVKGRLLAWDPVKGRYQWKVNYDVYINGGTLTTAGNLFFQGTGAGELIAYNAENGTKQWSFSLGSAIHAPPISFGINGDQKIAVLARLGSSVGRSVFRAEASTPESRHGPSRLSVFSLDGESQLASSKAHRVEEVPEPLAQTASLETIEYGERLFHGNQCLWCHGMEADTGLETVPDLRYLTKEKHGIWDAVV